MFIRYWALELSYQEFFSFYKKSICSVYLGLRGFGVIIT
jgi:hypothetical protein